MNIQRSKFLFRRPRVLIAFIAAFILFIASTGPGTTTAQGTRIVRVVNANAQAGQTVVVFVEIDSLGNEIGFQFALAFDPSVLSYVSVSPGNGLQPGSNLLSNATQASSGRVGFLIDAIQPLTAGTRRLVAITFNVSPNAPSQSSPVTFSTVPFGATIAGPGGTLVPATYQPGNLIIGGVGPSPTPTVAPSPTPTVAPSPTPTVAPSPTPTVAPSPTPTVAPSPTPTVAPSPTPGSTPNTLPGTNVFIQAPDGLSDVTFPAVTSAGITTFTPLQGSSAGTLPNGYLLPFNGTHRRINTTAGFVGPVVVCITVLGISDAEEFARLRILHREGQQLVDRTVLAPGVPAPDFASRRICASVNGPSDFYLAFGPVFNASGRVMTPLGQGIRNTVVSLTDSRGVRRVATTGSFGEYLFSEVRGGETYTITVTSKRYRFSPKVILVTGNLTDLNFVGLE